jgi:hypothetical protein
MSLIQSVGQRFKTVQELLGFFWKSRWWWLTPMILFLVLFSLFVVSAQGPLAPFIYTLF